MTDWQRAIFITRSARFRGNKFFPRHFRHCSEDALVVDTSRDQLALDHELTLRGKLWSWGSPLPATSRNNRCEKERLRGASHPQEYRKLRCYQSSTASLLRSSIASPLRSCYAADQPAPSSHGSRIAGAVE